ncbi:9186_t:CDS:2 [Scutellospora calospora]|uniref:9186_t:CDS:1 n=1 Tax=Scutellospora calospora TaxID=85575 RepID=A0ACA9KKY2_9GLOM|nr:9186_t:CDS:2 [Scutellospora calospora]
MSVATQYRKVLDEIKFLTQEYGLGAKVQCQYLLKKFTTQSLYDHDLYHAICKYKNQIDVTKTDRIVEALL